MRERPPSNLAGALAILGLSLITWGVLIEIAALIYKALEAL